MDKQQSRRDADAALIRNSLFNLGRALFSWWVLTPVVYVWGIVLLTTLVITFVNFESQTTSLMETIYIWGADLTARYPFLQRFELESSAIEDPRVISGNGGNLKAVIFETYAWVALPFIVIGMLLDLVRGPRPPRPLRRKLFIAFLVTLALVAVWFANFLFGSEIWNGSSLGWSFMFLLFGFLLFGFSTVMLSIHHVIASMHNSKGN
jgi:hypothetical protein